MACVLVEARHLTHVAVAALHAPPHRPVSGFAPTAKAARVRHEETGVAADTIAKLLGEWSRPDRLPGDRWQLGPQCTLIIDEAGMLGTRDLHRLMDLARQNTWRLVLVGDPHQLQAVGRGACSGDSGSPVVATAIGLGRRF